jgi:hypothetical protein
VEGIKVVKSEYTSEELMFKGTHGPAAVVLLVAIAICGVAGSQNDNNNKNDKGPAAKQIPEDPISGRQRKALGARVMGPDKKRTVYEGKFFNAAGESWNARATVQSPGCAKLEGFLDSKSILSFDGEKANKQMNRMEEALLEIFLMDSPEAFLRKSITNQFWGGGFGPDPRAT